MALAIVIMLIAALCIAGPVGLFKALLVAVFYNLIYILLPNDAFVIFYMITSMGIVMSHNIKKATP